MQDNFVYNLYVYLKVYPILCNCHINLGLLGSFFRLFSVGRTFSFYKISCPMSKFGRVNSHNQVKPAISKDMTDFQSKQLNHGKSWDRTSNFRHNGTLNVQL